MPRWSRVVALLAVLSIAACGSHRSPAAPTPPPSDGQPPPPPPPPPAPPTLKVTRILAFGDSLTEGVVQPPAPMLALDAGAAPSYPYKLQELEKARYTDQTISVFNAGKSGERALDARDRFGQMISAAQPEVVLLMEGTNDLGQLLNESNISIKDAITKIVNGMEDMVRDAQYRGVAIFVATIPAQRSTGAKGQGASLIDPYNAALRTMVQKKGATLVDVNAQLPLSLVGLDGLHLTDEGYEKLAEIFQAALAAAYEVPPATSSASARLVRRGVVTASLFAADRR